MNNANRFGLAPDCAVIYDLAHQLHAAISEVSDARQGVPGADAAAAAMVGRVCAEAVDTHMLAHAATGQCFPLGFEHATDEYDTDRQRQQYAPSLGSVAMAGMVRQ